MKLFVFSTNRALKKFYLDFEDSLLPHATTIKEFFNDIIVVNGKSKITKKIKQVIIWDILNEFDAKKIGFDKAFLRFIESSPFMLSFFDEIESSKIDIESIDTNDTYGDYEDHLKIIKKIYDQYKKTLQERNLYSNPDNYQINMSYVNYYDEIHISIDGILNNTELGIIKEAAKYTDIRLVCQSSKYNEFIFKNLTNEKIESNNKYIISAQSGKILNTKNIKSNNQVINLYSFSMRINQALLVIAKVNEWLEQGYSNIVVVLPDEHFAKYLMLFDSGNNLNYAMGIEDINLIRKIKNIKGLVQDNGKPKIENIISEISKISMTLRDELLEFLSFSEIFENLSYDDILDFIINNIKKMDDNNGGKVSVVGVLETRGLEFDKCIIVDFNDDFVPVINDNDIFLNTSIRKKVKLPTIRQKEDLQRHYYINLINNSKEVCIGFCSNKAHSSIIHDLGLRASDAINGERSWRFFPKNIKKDYIDDYITGNCSNLKLSASKIKDFIECKRRFYFKYIEGLIPDNDNKNAYLGSTIHDILKNMGQNMSIDAFKGILAGGDFDASQNVELESIGNRMLPFFQSNANLLKNGRSILGQEIQFSTNIFGYDFSGRIDRIDREGDNIYIIDYKIKNKFDVKKETFLQLFIYKKAIKGIYDNCEIQALYYDVLNNQQHYMNKLDEEEQEKILNETIDEIKKEMVTFDKTEKDSNCRYCDYKHFCNVR